MGKGTRNRKIRKFAAQQDPQYSKLLARYLRKQYKQLRRNNAPRI